MLLKWFNAREAKEFGVSLAKFYMERVPPNTADTKKSNEKQQEVLKKILRQMDAYNSTYKLNIYKKAQLGNRFKWTLIQGGYEPKFVDKLTQLLMAH